MSAEAVAYLSQFSKEFSPEKKGGNFSNRPKLEAIEDGKYTFTVRSSSLEMAAGKPIWRLGLETGGTVYEYTFWIDSQISANIVGVFLIGLGVPADRWGPGTFHKQIQGAIASVVGARFKGEKKKNNKGYAVLYANDYLGKSSGGSEPAPQAYDDPDEAPF